MLKALEYKIKYIQLVNELGKIFNGTEYEVKYNEFERQFQNISDREKIHIVVAGDWSTGKSTLIKALTDNDSIGIDTDIKTNTPHTYEYNGVCIVDTPGLNSGNNEHTRLTEREIKCADRVIYCITAQQEFGPKIIKEFVAIANQFDAESKTILAVTKFGLETTTDDPMDVMYRMRFDIKNKLMENGLGDDKYILRIFSAERYIEGKKNKRDEQVEASYFSEFIKSIENPDNNDEEFLNNGEESLTWRKCRNQGKMIDKFISEIMDEISSKYAMEEKNDQKLTEKRKEIQKKIQEEKRKTIDVLKIEIKELIKDVLDTNSDIDESGIKDKVERQLQERLTKVGQYMHDSISQIDKVLSEIPNINNNITLKTETDNRKRSIGLLKILSDRAIFSKGGEMFGEGIEKVREAAQPVEVGKKRHLFRKSEIIMSKAGGKGTRLYDNLTKLFPAHGAQMSEIIGKLSIKMIENKELLAIAGDVVDVGISIGSSLKEEHAEKKRRRFRKELFSEVHDIQKLTEKAIEDQFEKMSRDVDKKCIDTDSENGKLLRDLQEKRNRLERLTDDFNEVGNNE